MRRSSLACAVLLCLVGCVVPLDDEFDDACSPPVDAGTPDAGAPPPLAPGCLLFGGPSSALAQLSGASRDIDLGNGERGLIFDSAGGIANAMVTVPAATVGSLCTLTWPPDGGPTSAFTDAGGPTFFYAALDGVRAAGTTSVFFSASLLDPAQPFGVLPLGVGLASAQQGEFAPGPVLFAADQPNWGVAVVASGNTASVFGCRSGGFLETECFLAQAPTSSLSDPSTYLYFTDAGDWSMDSTSAAVLFTGGTPLSVTQDPATGEAWATYVAPFAQELSFRWAPALTGPWSEAMGLATCALPSEDPDAFCEGAIQHAKVDAGGALSITYAIGTLNPDAGALLAANPGAYWPRLVTLPIPPH